MSANEQEVRKKIAEMRVALESMRGAARTGAVVKVLGVVIGLGIVALLIWASYEYRVKPLQDVSKWRPVVEKRGKAILDNMQLKQNAPRLAKEVADVYAKEAQDMLKDMDLTGTVNKEVDAFLGELQPLLMAQLDRARPRVVAMMQSQGEKLRADLEALLEKKVNDRLAAILANQEGYIQKETGLSHEKMLVILGNLRVATQEAAKRMIVARVERNMDHIMKINDLLMAVPQMPKTMTQDDMIQNLGMALLARARYELPSVDEVMKPGEAK